MPLMPWELTRTRAEDAPNANADSVVAQIGATGRQVADFAFQGRAGLGAGIASGIAQAGTAIGAGMVHAADRESDPAMAYRRLMLDRQQATDEVLRGVNYQTPEEHYGGPVDPQTGQRAGIPPLDNSARYLWERLGRGKFDDLPSTAQRRLTEVVGTLQTTKVPVYRDTPEMKSAMGRADSGVVADLKEKGTTPEQLPQQLENRFRQAVFGDSMLQEALVRGDLEQRPIREAERAGHAPLAKALEAFKGNPEVARVAQALWPAMMSSAPVVIGDAPMTLAEAATLRPDLTLDEVRALTGKMTVQAPSVMIDTDGQVRDEPARRNAWIKEQKDKESYLSSMAHKPWRDLVYSSHVFDQGRSVVQGYMGKGPYRLEMKDDARAKWVASGMASLVKKYGEPAIAGMVGKRLLGLPGTDAQILGDQAPKGEEIGKALDTVMQAVDGDATAKLGELSPKNSVGWAAVVRDSWQRQLSPATMTVAGPLQDYADIPATALQAAWNQLGSNIKGDVPWQELERALRGRGLSGPELATATAAAHSEFQGQRRFLEASFQSIDPKGRSWDAVDPKERETTLRALGDVVVENLMGGGRERVKLSPSAKELLPAKDQPMPMRPQEAQEHFDKLAATGQVRKTGVVQVETRDGVTMEYRDGRFARAFNTQTGESYPQPAKDDFAQVRIQAWIPAQDVYRGLKKQLGSSNPWEVFSRYQTRAPFLWEKHPLVAEVLDAQETGNSLYRHVQEVLEKGQGDDLATAYNAVLGRIAQVAKRRGSSLGEMVREFDAAATLEADEPVVNAISVMLGEAHSSQKVGYDDRQFARSSESVFQMFPELAYRHQGEGFVDPLVPQLLDPAQELPPNPVSPAQQFLDQSLVMPWDKGLWDEGPFNDMGGRAASVANLGLLGVPGLVNNATRGLRTDYNASFEAMNRVVANAIAAGKSYELPVGNGETIYVSKGDAEYGKLTLPLRDPQAFRQWLYEKQAKERRR